MQAAAQQRRQQAPRGRPQQHPSEVDAEELFRAFFGGGVPGGFAFHTGGFHGGRPAARRPPPGPPPPPEDLRDVLRQLQPLILLFLVVILPTLLGGAGDSPSLRRTGSHREALVSAQRRVTYYVPDAAGFEARHPTGSAWRERVERELESSYGQHLASRCNEEALRERWGQVRRGSHKPACDELERSYSDIYTGFSNY